MTESVSESVEPTVLIIDCYSQAFDSDEAPKIQGTPEATKTQAIPEDLVQPITADMVTTCKVLFVSLSFMYWIKKKKILKKCQPF